MKKLLFIGGRASIRLSKECTPFVSYMVPTSKEKTLTTNTPKQNKDFKDVFLKKNTTRAPTI